MAKYENRFKGNFFEVLRLLENGIINSSLSASYENGSDYQNGEIKCAVRVYERYSMIGSNRVSLSFTLIGDGDYLFLSAITSGGSQAMFFKFNTFGEEAFLDCLIKVLNSYNYEG